MVKQLDFLWSLSRFNKRLISLAVDASFVCLAFFCAYWARLGEFSEFKTDSVWFVLAGTVFVTLLVNARLGLYRAILRYLTFHAFTAILFGAAVSALSVTTLAYFFQAPIPRTVPIIYFPFLVMLCGGSRLLIRGLLLHAPTKGCESVLVFGAGSTGRQLALALRQASSYRVKGFIDHDASLANTIIQGTPVYNVDKIDDLIEKFHISKLLLAIPRASRSERKKVIDRLLPYAVEVLTVPDFDDIVTGKAKISELQDVAVDDLLGRDVVAPVASLMQSNIAGKVVMVTGAGGSIGSELCRQRVVEQATNWGLCVSSVFAGYAIDEDVLVCAGFYSINGRNSIKGTFYMTIDLNTQAVLKSTFKEIPEDFITQDWTEKQLNKAKKKESKKGKKIEAYEFALRDFVLKDGGGARLLAEQYYVHVVTTTTTDANGNTTTRTTYHYYYNYVYIIYSAADGSINWLSKVDKYQHSINDGGYRSSYSLHVKEDKMYLMYNLRAKDYYEKEERTEMSRKDKKAYLTFISEVDNKGNIVDEILINHSEEETYVIPKFCEQITSNKNLIYTGKGKTQQIGIATFK